MLYIVISAGTSVPPGPLYSYWPPGVAPATVCLAVHLFVDFSHPSTQDMFDILSVKIGLRTVLVKCMFSCPSLSIDRPGSPLFFFLRLCYLH